MATNPKRAKRVDDLSPTQLQRADLVIRQTFEKLTALFIVVRNLQAEVQSLQETIKRSNQLWQAALEDPEASKQALWQQLAAAQQRIDNARRDRT